MGYRILNSFLVISILMSINGYSQNHPKDSLINKKDDEVHNRGCYGAYIQNDSFRIISKVLLNEQFGSDIIHKLNKSSGCLILRSQKPDTAINQHPLHCPNFATLPLIVLNDKIFEGSINTLNPNDIESITILKDSAATSIHSGGTANGVIVITTKKYKHKKRKKKVTVIDDEVPKNPAGIR